MSIPYDKEIFSNEKLKLKVNFYGLKDDIASAENLSMSFYAYTTTGQPIFSETLNYEQIKSLYTHLNGISIIRDSDRNISGKFIESTAEISQILEKLNSLDPDILKIILGKLKEEDRISNLFSFLTEYEIDTLSSLRKLQVWNAEIENLKKLLEFEAAGNVVELVLKDESLKSYKAGQPEKIFQNWIEKNHQWIFGIEYIQKHDERKIALYSEGDLLMELVDGFLDLIELKRPIHEIFNYDSSHKSYYPSQDLSKVIGQCLYYLQKMDDLKLALEKEYKVRIIRPRIKIIIGRTTHFEDEQFNALRMLNCQLSHIEVISYDTLLKYGEKMISNYK